MTATSCLWWVSLFDVTVGVSGGFGRLWDLLVVARCWVDVSFGMCFLLVTVVAGIAALWCAVLLVTRESDVAVRTQ